MTTKSTSQQTADALERIAVALEAQTEMMRQKNDVIMKNQKKMKEQIAALVDKYAKFDKVLARAGADLGVSMQEEEIITAQEIELEPEAKISPSRKVIRMRSTEADFAEMPDEKFSDQDTKPLQLSIDDYPLDGEEKGQPVDLQPAPRVQHTEEEIEKLQDKIEEIMGKKLNVSIGMVDKDDKGNDTKVNESIEDETEK